MVGTDDSLCVDRGLVDFGLGHRFCHAKAEVLKGIISAELPVTLLTRFVPT